MKKIIFTIFALVVLAAPFISKAQTKKQAVYFYADWCPHCQNVNEYFTEQGFYDKYDIQKLNFDDQKNKILLQKIFKAKKISQVGIPAIVIDDQVITGDVDIINDFEKTIEKSNGTVWQFINGVAGDKTPAQNKNIGMANKEDNKGGVALPVLISAALVDAINPCAFAVLILLVATVVKSQGKRRALWAGLMFSFAIFVSYFLMGLGLYKAITIFNLPKIISAIVGIIAVLIGLANLKDAFWYGKWFVMEVPFSWRPKMQTILKHVTSPLGALSAGILVSLFLLPCSSGPYVVIVGLLAERVNMLSTVSQLALYNLIFVTPMILITLAMYFFNIKGSKLEALRKDNLKVLHAIAGTIMLIMGIYLLKGWL